MPIALAASFLLTVASLAPPSPGPTLAREDTMHTEVSEVLVTAPRVTLNEILDRVARGEARRDSMIRDQVFTATIRMVRGATKDSAASVFEEQVYRVYKKKPDRVRTVRLREWKAKPDKKKPAANVTFRSNMSEEIVNFAFQPAARRDYKYRILGRDLLGNHLIYRIAFEPRSTLDPSEPSGLVWVDTNDFVIVRQEVNFDRTPVPIFLKDIDRMVVERQRLGDFWVLSRVLLRATMQFTIPKFGKSFDLSIRYDQYAINQGVPDSLFEAVGR